MSDTTFQGAERSPDAKRVLVIEDSESKWKEVEGALITLKNNAITITRAGTLVDAEKAVSNDSWDLIVLDISMDITASIVGPKSGGHDTLGGLRIANKMFLLGREAPTIIVTAFDAFPSAEGRQGVAEVLGLEDVRESASKILGTAFCGCVRYGDADWKSDFSQLTSEVLFK